MGFLVRISFVLHRKEGLKGSFFVLARKKIASCRQEAECWSCIARVSMGVWTLWLLWCVEIRRCESPNLKLMEPLIAMIVVGSGRRLT